jgi:hypothetical protein
MTALYKALPQSERLRAKARRRFESYVDRDGACWTWTAGRTNAGYGRFYIRENNEPRTVLAHRAAFEFAHGPLPQGKLVCHTCDNPPCVREDHLFAGTYSDNARDAVAKGRHHSQPPVPEHKTVCCLGHAMTPENTYIPPRKPNVRACRSCRRLRQRADWRIAQ